MDYLTLALAVLIPVQVSAVYIPGTKLWDAATPGDLIAGTEVQALVEYKGQLFAGTTNWKETSSNIWPKYSAQVIYQAQEFGSFAPTNEIDLGMRNPTDPALYEQINSLITVGSGNDETLLAATFANEDDYTLLHGTVFKFNDATLTWTNTGLDQVLPNYYSVTTEVRYTSSYIEATTGNTIVLAAVGPRAVATPIEGPSVWKGVVSFSPSFSIAWASAPEVALDGTDGFPIADRIVSLISTPFGSYLGTHEDGYAADRNVILRREDSTGVWSILKEFPPIGQPGYVDAVRGLNVVDRGNGDYTLFALLHPAGQVNRYEFNVNNPNVPTSSAEPEIQLVPYEVPGCIGSSFYGYQIHRQVVDGVDYLMVASMSCGNLSTGRILVRRVSACNENAISTCWFTVEVSGLEDNRRTAVRENAVRWLAQSPFDSNTVIIGTTDMINQPGSQTGEIWQI